MRERAVFMDVKKSIDNYSSGLEDLGWGARSSIPTECLTQDARSPVSLRRDGAFVHFKHSISLDNGQHIVRIADTGIFTKENREGVFPWV